MLDFNAIVQSIDSENGKALLAILSATANAVTIAKDGRLGTRIQWLTKLLTRAETNSDNSSDNNCSNNKIKEEIEGRFKRIEGNILEIEEVILDFYKEYLKDRLVEIVNNEESLPIVKTTLIEVRQINGFVLNQASLCNLYPNSNRRVFLYLASNNFAGMRTTLDIAIHNQFLWRKYHRNNGNGIVNRVDQIQVGDIIVLAYRVPNRRFRVLSPLVVHPEVNGLAEINDVPMPQNTPFRFVSNQNLIQILNNSNYQIDQTVGAQVGLPVCMLETDLETPQAQTIFNGIWESPGPDAVYELNSVNPRNQFYIDPTVRDWMQTLA